MTDTKNTVSDEQLAGLISYFELRDPGTSHALASDTEGALRELQSLRASIPGGVGVKVKPLAWKPFTSDEDVSFMFAAAFGVRYEVFHKASDVAKIGIQVARMQHVDGLLIDDDDEETTTIIGYGKDLDAAYAIAQADYERRILSALDLSPAEGEPVAFVVIRPMRSGKVEMHLPFLRAGEEADRYRVANPDESLLALYAAPSNPVVSDDLRHAFRNADKTDWAHLLAYLPDTHRGRFWKAVMTEALAALSVKPQSGGRKA